MTTHLARAARAAGRIAFAALVAGLATVMGVLLVLVLLSANLPVVAAVVALTYGAFYPVARGRLLGASVHYSPQVTTSDMVGGAA